MLKFGGGGRGSESEGPGGGDATARSLRSMDSSAQLADGRPEVTRVSRTKTMFRGRKKSVAPMGHCDAAALEDSPEGILFLNNPPPFALRSLFQRAKSVPSLQHPGAPGSGGGGGGGSEPGRGHLRAHEELCLVLSKPLAKGGRTKKSWFMYPGFIGRDGGENVVVATKDPTMDALHAEILVDGDDYLIRDNASAGGTFLCLSTTNRHHPQRDGFRLRPGDVFVVGEGARVAINAITTTARIATQAPLLKRNSTRSKLDRRLTDTNSMERHASVVLHRTPSRANVTPSFNKKTVRFAESVQAPADPNVEPRLPTDDGGTFPLGPRYKRRKKLVYPLYRELTPGPLSVTISSAERPDESATLNLDPKAVYTIGSSPWCDIQVVSDGVYAVHARIVFDGHFFVLQDLSFEDNPKKKTRVALTTATRIGRGDTLLLGKCALNVVNVYRAFRDHEPDLKEVAFKCHLLRPSKRKSRRREKYLPVAFKHAQSEAFVLGKGNMCDGQVYTASLCVEQFAIQLDHGQCSLTPRFAGINQGMYFLLGRNSIPHETRYKEDVIRYTSKALMLVEGSVFRVGSSEIEVTYVKLEDVSDAMTRPSEIRENIQFIKAMPWIQQIGFDRHAIDNLAKRSQRLCLEAGESVYDEGDPASFLFIVLDGEIQLSYSQKGRRGSVQRSGTISNLTSPTPGMLTTETEILIETVGPGSFFGEASLWTDNPDYADSAKAHTPCQLLVLSREDICGYFSYYMDIIRPHVSYEAHKDLLQKMRLTIPWCANISYQELRGIASKAERIYFQMDDYILREGSFRHHGRPRHGMLLLRYGAVHVVDSEGKPVMMDPDPASLAIANDCNMDDLVANAESVEGGSSSPAIGIIQSWAIDTPLVIFPKASPSPLYENLRARTNVQCFFIDISAFQHLLKKSESRQASGAAVIKTVAGSAPPPILRRRSTNRRSSYATQFKARHSQVFTTALRANTNDDGSNLIENADLEDSNDPSRKWRRKKRNKNLLEKTILETQQNTELMNALVLYVLSGANRGDIHVVRNVATLGGIISGADIELNDAYVSKQHAVIEHREGRYWLYDTFSDWGTYVRLEESQTVQIYPGDVFLAGEVEFTCMGSFPERKKSSMCCIQ